MPWVETSARLEFMVAVSLPKTLATRRDAFAVVTTAALVLPVYWTEAMVPPPPPPPPPQAANSNITIVVENPLPIRNQQVYMLAPSQGSKLQSGPVSSSSDKSRAKIMTGSF
jgi:hypothetical protein